MAFTSINVPKEVAEDMKYLKIAYAYTTGNMISYGDIIEDLIRNLESANPALYQTFLSVQSDQKTEV